jgi:hypothetical protein
MSEPYSVQQVVQVSADYQFKSTGAALQYVTIFSEYFILNYNRLNRI